MSQELLSRLAPRIKELRNGAYRRTYIGHGRQRRTSTHQLVADLLGSLKVRFRENVPIRGARGLMADFMVNGVAVFVERDLTSGELKRLSATRGEYLIIARDPLRSDRLDHGLRVLSLGEEGRTQGIFLDDPSFNFDYAHILPKTQKCSVMHGHTSSVLVEVVGHPNEGMVVDFADAKKAVKNAINKLDHRLFINEKYVTGVSQRSVSLKFKTVHGDFAIRAPRETTVLLPGEATVENLAKEVLSLIVPKMPPNVTAVGVYVYEGMNKGSHLLASVLQDGVVSARRKP